MVKRILTIAAGVLLGSCLALGGAEFLAVHGWFFNRGLDRSTAYLREVLELVNEHYVDGKKAEYPELTKAALHAMVETLDPHSEFMDATDFHELEEEMSSEFGGIGVQLELRDKRIVVVAPIADTPGERAGIRRGDEIVKIDDRPLEKPLMDDVISKLRGKPKTSVKIGFFRPSTKQEFEATIVRELIKTESVRDVHVLEGGIGYVQITQFAERTGEEFINALNKLSEQNVRGLIIDLRNNPGGLLDAAVQVAEPFFPKGETIVYTQGRRANDREDYKSESNDPAITLPTVVLLNAGSASASEVVAGALKDTNRAIIVGERSFGKGSVQSIFKLKNGEGMRLTTAKYFTPSGVTIHEKGVAPQVEVVMTPEEDENVRLQRARRDVTDPAAFKERFGVDLLEDRQLAAGLDVLRAVSLFDERTADDAKPEAAPVTH
jgi:carboxyl-terminal processing protease